MRRSRNSAQRRGRGCRGWRRKSRQREMAHARWLAVAVVAACSAPPVRPAAPACPEGAMVVASRGDLARLAGCATLRGLTVRSGAALDLSALRALTAIAGDLVIGPTAAIEDIELGGLRE